MAEWINAQVKEVKNWTDALFSLRVKAPIAPSMPDSTQNWHSKLRANVCSELTLTSMHPMTTCLSST